MVWEYLGLAFDPFYSPGCYDYSERKNGVFVVLRYNSPYIEVIFWTTNLKNSRLQIITRLLFNSQQLSTLNMI